MRTIIIIISILLVNPNILHCQENQTFVAENYITKNFDVAIFPKTYIEMLPDNRFTPTKSQVEQAELALHTNLKSLNSKKINQISTPIIDKRLKKYRRQYFGYIDENGDEVLIINAFWKSREDKKEIWLNEYIRVLDGGSFYWEIKYNVTKSKLFDLMVNGYA